MTAAGQTLVREGEQRGGGTEHEVTVGRLCFRRKPPITRRNLGAVEIRGWPLVVAGVVAVSLLFELVGLPSPVLFGALLAGLVYALVASRRLQVPGPVFTGGQAILGVAIGGYFDPGTLTELGDDWLPVLLVCLATLLLSVLAGFVLRLQRGVSAATGAFAMIAGGASGVVAIARELGADDRVVAVVQYLRVLVIILGMPLVTAWVFDPGSGDAAALPAASSGFLEGLAFTVVCVVVGLVLARWVRIPAASLLLPLVVAVLLVLAGWDVTVPAALQNLGFALIGLQVGLRFTRESLRAVGRLLPLALVTILGLIAASAALGVVLARATGQSPLDGYLATTPGGLYAVLATAIGNGSDVTFVLTVQIVRLFVMLFSAPLVAGALRRFSAEDQNMK